MLESLCLVSRWLETPLARVWMVTTMHELQYLPTITASAVARRSMRRRAQ